MPILLPNSALLIPFYLESYFYLHVNATLVIIEVLLIMVFEKENSCKRVYLMSCDDMFALCLTKGANKLH